MDSPLQKKEGRLSFVYNEGPIIGYLLLDEALEAFPAVVSKVAGPVALPTELGVHNYDLTFDKSP